MLLKVYAKFKDMFSKAVLEKLLLYCLYNHKIKIKRENIIKYSPLCYQSINELFVIKKFLIQSLDKGLIKVS